MCVCARTCMCACVRVCLYVCARECHHTKVITSAPCSKTCLGSPFFLWLVTMEHPRSHMLQFSSSPSRLLRSFLSVFSLSFTHARPLQEDDYSDDELPDVDGAATGRLEEDDDEEEGIEDDEASAEEDEEATEEEEEEGFDEDDEDNLEFLLGKRK